MAASGVEVATPTPTLAALLVNNHHINTCQLLLCALSLILHPTTMEGEYSFADGGPIPTTANVSKARQPATKDLSQKFKPRFEDGSEIQLQFMPSLARRADQELLDYLQKRKISFHFLNDIDDFLKRHPGLLKACPNWCYQLSTLPPLQAYLFFIKGYLRPARYIDGVSTVKHWVDTLLTYIHRLYQLQRMSRFLFVQSRWSITRTIPSSTITSRILVNAWNC